MKRDRVLLALACGCEAAVAIYVVTRVLQALVLSQPNPALASAGLHSSYFWRAWVAAYGGAFVSLTVALLGRTIERGVHVASAALPWVAVALVVQSLLMP